MNTNTSIRIATLRALTVLGLGALSCLAAGAARADVYADQINVPSQQMGQPASATTLQFHVVNTDDATVNNNKISITLQTWADGPTGKQFNLSSTFNLTAYEQEWITITIPATENGQKLKGQELKGQATLGAHKYYLDFNDDGAYNPWPQVKPAKLQITKFTDPTQQKNGAPFSITVTNNGGSDSIPTTLKVIMQPWADGPDGPSYTKTATVPVLMPGQSAKITFDAVDYDSDELEVTIDLNNVFQMDASFWG